MILGVLFIRRIGSFWRLILQAGKMNLQRRLGGWKGM
jgi:hypothetical protein